MPDSPHDVLRWALCAHDILYRDCKEPACATWMAGERKRLNLPEAEATPSTWYANGAAAERARIVAELRFIAASDVSGRSRMPTVLAYVARRWADDIEAIRPLRGSS